ncbi:hypothetical protein ANN_25001 [Periplaneta americana]|uniref:Uncharacterized protein n=1 Tax=Periplaneta americana TaxID=6978 RepID=A0ABQ8S0R6_PERAM|nr:hypothetical protein ANN_25001 [Periplaneta americana]
MDVEPHAFHDLGTRMRWCGRHHALTAFYPREGPGTQFYRRLSEPLGRSESLATRKNPLTTWDRIPDLPVHTRRTIPQLMERIVHTIQMVTPEMLSRVHEEMSEHSSGRQTYSELRVMIGVSGLLLRNSRHHLVRSKIAAALRNKGWIVEEEISGLAENGSTRRVDILAYNADIIVDPTIRFEVECHQSAEVHLEKKSKMSLQYTAGYTKWDHKRNEDVMEELQLEPVINHVKHYQNNWVNHLHRMRRDRIPKVMLHYRPNGKRSLGRPKKRLIENSTFKVCHGSLYAVMWLVDEPREFNLPTLPQRCITSAREVAYQVRRSFRRVLTDTYGNAGSGRNVNCFETCTEATSLTQKLKLASSRRLINSDVMTHFEMNTQYSTTTSTVGQGLNGTRILQLCGSSWAHYIEISYKTGFGAYNSDTTAVTKSNEKERRGLEPETLTSEFRRSSTKLRGHK